MINSTIVRVSSRVVTLLYVLVAPELGYGQVSMRPPTHEVGSQMLDMRQQTALFLAVVQSLASTEERPLRVDPRPLIGDPRITHPHPRAFAPVDSGVVQRRSRVLRTLGVPQGDRIEDGKCAALSGGIPANPLPGFPAPPPASDSVRLARQECSKKGRFAAVILGLPRRGGAYYPPLSIDEREEGLRRGYWTTRVNMVTEFSDVVLDVVAAPSSSGNGWKIVRRVELLNMQS